MTSGELLEVRQKGLASEWSTGSRVPTELGKTVRLLKEEGTPIRDVGKHVRGDRQGIVCLLANEPLGTGPLVVPWSPSDSGSNRVSEHISDGSEQVSGVRS